MCQACQLPALKPSCLQLSHPARLAARAHTCCRPHCSQQPQKPPVPALPCCSAFAFAPGRQCIAFAPRCCRTMAVSDLAALAVPRRSPAVIVAQRLQTARHTSCRRQPCSRPWLSPMAANARHCQERWQCRHPVAVQTVIPSLALPKPRRRPPPGIAARRQPPDSVKPSCFQASRHRMSFCRSAGHGRTHHAALSPYLVRLPQLPWGKKATRKSHAPPHWLLSLT